VVVDSNATISGASASHRAQLDEQSRQIQILRELLCKQSNSIHIARFGMVISWFGPLICTRGSRSTTLLQRVRESK